MITQGNFGSDFLERIPELEKAMVGHNLDPEDFIVAKNASHRRAFSFDYMVTVDGQSFTVNMANDMEFLKYFYGICFPPEENAQTHPAERKLSALLQRLEKWLTEDSLKEQKD